MRDPGKIHSGVGRAGGVGSWVGLTAALVVSVAAPAGAFTIIDDDFSDGSRFQTGATDASWLVHLVGPTSVADDSGGLGSGNALVLGAGGSANSNVAQFALVGLGVGDSIRFSFDARGVSPLVFPEHLRFGLFDSNGIVASDGGGEVGIDGPARGYTGAIAVTPPASAVSGATFGIFGGGGTVALDGGGTPALDIQSAIGTLGVRLELRITREATRNLVQMLLDGSVIWADTDTPGLTTTFDTVGFYNYGGGNEYRFDNVRVEVVPEPATGALFSLGLAALAARRRRG